LPSQCDRSTTLNDFARLVAKSRLSEVKQDEDNLCYGGGVTGTGYVEGPSSSTDNALVRFDGAGGKTIQNSGVVVDDGNNVTGVVDLTASGDISADGASLTNPLPHTSGGTGVSADPSDGKLLIGNSSIIGYSLANLTAGTGITIVNGAGSISISADNNGDVVGPPSATDNAIARYDSTTGKLIQNSGVTLDDGNNAGGLGSVQIDEASSAPIPVPGGQGLLWVKDSEPTSPRFTDDTGTDHELMIGTFA
jgi:hypothetical protein